MMNVKTLKNLLNPQNGYYDQMDVITFLKDKSISKFTKAEVLYGKIWVNIPNIHVMLQQMEDDPEQFLKELDFVLSYPVGY